MNKNVINLPGSPDIIQKGDDRIESYREDTVMCGDPDALLRARDEKDIKEALIYCNGNKIPITICASQTSMTGASVATEGLLVSAERLEGVTGIEKYQGRDCVVARPGTIVSDLQKAAAEAGFFYPVGPTSRDECRIGGNIATNATGEDSFKYGPLRQYVRRIRIIMLDGGERILERGKDERGSDAHNLAGYFIEWKNPIDLIIGSEGTLAYIAEVTLELLPPPPNFFSALIPFPSNENALKFLIKNVQNRTKNLRTLEFIDSGAFKAMQTAEGFHQFSNETVSLVYFKSEYKDENEEAEILEKLYGECINSAGEGLANEIVVAETDKQKENFRLWRHRIPEWANEEGRKLWEDKGGKVGGDWWVPVDHLLEMMSFFYKEADATSLPYIAYAHLGRGHPHTNLFAKDAKEKDRAEGILIRCCKRAVSLGGGVTGEHGIGKLHRNLVPIQYSDKIIGQMKKWKNEYDPNWILGRGNIFQ